MFDDVRRVFKILLFSNEKNIVLTTFASNINT